MVTFENLPQAVESLSQKLDRLESLLTNQTKTTNSLNPSERLTRREIKEQYKVSYGTIHNLMNKDKLPYSKVGRKTLFLRKDVESCFGPNASSNL